MDINPYQSPQLVDDQVESAEFSASGQLECDQCGGTDFILRDWYHAGGIIWLLNPVAAVMEIVLGIRIAERTLTCRRCRSWWKPAREYCQCPSCHQLHRTDFWLSTLGNWTGLICPDCGGTIAPMKSWPMHMIVAVQAVLPITPARGTLQRWGQLQAIRGRERSLKQLPRLHTSQVERT